MKPPKGRTTIIIERRHTVTEVTGGAGALGEPMLRALFRAVADHIDPEGDTLTFHWNGTDYRITSDPPPQDQVEEAVPAV